MAAGRLSRRRTRRRLHPAVRPAQLAAEQGEQRDVVDVGYAFGIAGPQPLDDRVVSHGNSVSTREVAVETSLARVKRLSFAIPYVFTELILDAGRRDVPGQRFSSVRGSRGPGTGSGPP